MNEKVIVSAIIYASLLRSTANTNNNAEMLADQSIRYADYLLKRIKTD